MICTSITKLEALEGMDVLLVRFDDGTEAHWFYNEALALEYVNQSVIVSFRNDMYKGNVVRTINTFTMPSKVNVVERRDNIKLFSDQEDNLSNLSFNDLKNGETKTGCLFYCISYQSKTSEKAVWVEMKIRDRSLRVATLRVFDSDGATTDLTGSYCMAALTKSEYGFQTKKVVAANGTCPRNVEIDIAKSYLETYFTGDTPAIAFIEAMDLFHKMEDVVDYERGYGLVRMAMELSMCEQMYNITNSLDIKLMEYAILASRAHYCTNMQFSDDVANIIMTIRCKWPDVTRLVAMLDPGEVERRPDEYAVLCRVRDTVSTILEKKKEYK